jgi:spermidine synthase
MPAFGGWLTALIGAEPGPLRHWVLSFLLPFLLLLPATAAMGATLPAMERVLGALRDTGYSIAALYAINTAGAVAGVLEGRFGSRQHRLECDGRHRDRFQPRLRRARLGRAERC